MSGILTLFCFLFALGQVDSRIFWVVKEEICLWDTFARSLGCCQPGHRMDAGVPALKLGFICSESITNKIYISAIIEKSQAV